MNRRQYLGTVTATAGTFALAGCSDDGGSAGDDEDEDDDSEPTDADGPRYDQSQTQAMLLTTDDFPEGWTRDDSINEEFDAAFENGDGSAVVLQTVDIEDNAGTAATRYDDTRSSFSDPKSYDLAEEAFWDTRDEQFAYTIFRHANAIGQTAALRESGSDIVPDETRAQQYASALYDHWQTL